MLFAFKINSLIFFNLLIVVLAVFSIIYHINDKRKIREKEIYFLQKAISHINDSVMIGKINEKFEISHFIAANEIACKKLGYSIEEIVKMKPADITHPDCLSKIPQARKLLYSKNASTIEFIHITKTGENIPVEINSKVMEIGKDKFLVTIARDISKRKELEKSLRENEQHYKSLFEFNPNGIMSFDLDGYFTSVNKACEELTGYKKEDLFKISFHQFIAPEDREMVQTYFEKAKQGNAQRYVCHINNHRNEFLCIDVTNVPIFIENEVRGIYSIVKDITASRDTEQRLNFLAYHDQLTGLPNRIKLQNIFHDLLVECARSNSHFAVLFIDLDRFKLINDTMGHEIGDLLIKQASNRLVGSVQQEDVVSRHGGDEFIILLKDADKLTAELSAKRILDSFSAPFILKNQEFYTSPSIGISLYPIDGQDITTLTKHADKAMYVAKKKGKNNYQFYIHEDETNLKRRIKLERGLKKALINNELELYYQPKVQLKTGCIYGVEALARWFHPELGLISPKEFIPIAEETGMIIPIGDWVLKTACKQNKQWQESGIDILMSINVSPIQFQDNFFPKKVKEVLDENQLSPEYFGIEITESVMQNTNQSSGIIRELKEQGVKVSIDDFGTGYSSLSVLNKLPIDHVKVDKSFVHGILENANTAALVRTIIDMGGNLNFGLVAEGIENMQQAEFLIKNGCYFGQGFFYSPPIPSNEVENLMKNQLLEGEKRL